MQHPETMEVIYTSYPDGGLVTINKSDFDPVLHSLKPVTKKRGRPRKKPITEATNGDR